jgi:hypothetical protein
LVLGISVADGRLEQSQLPRDEKAMVDAPRIDPNGGAVILGEGASLPAEGQQGLKIPTGLAFVFDGDVGPLLDDLESDMRAIVHSVCEANGRGA